MHMRRGRSSAFGTLAILGALALAGCNPNNNENINTAYAKVLHTGQIVAAPLGGQPIIGTYQSSITNGSVPPFGSTMYFNGVTSNATAASFVASELGEGWPTTYNSANDLMPAYWTIQWSHPPECLSPTSPYGLLPNPSIATYNFEPTSNEGDGGPNQNLYCYVNSPLDPDFIPENMSPQLSLDNAVPSTMQVAALLPMVGSPTITNLHVIGTNLSNPSNVSAISISPNQMSAVFPYPTQANGSSLPAGAYLVTITTDPTGIPQTTNGMEAFYVAHDDTSFTGAYGVAVASPRQSTTWVTGTTGHIAGVCQNSTSNSSVVGGTPLPLVTLLTQASLAVGTASKTIPVGNDPTVVIPFNDQPRVTTIGLPTACDHSVISYSGAQSALVINTGSNSVSVVQIGTYAYPAGTVGVGSQPVAAVINSAETMAYIANYGSGTVSEVNLSTLRQTRVIPVMTHPASITFDTNGNLWVGGQGNVMNINVPIGS